MKLRAGTPEEAGFDTYRIGRVGELCRSWVEQDVHKALAVLVARRGVIALHEAFGPVGPHGAPPLRHDSIFPMMSLSKVVTATALMILVEDGLVGLTRPVQEYIPEFEGEGKDQVCVHHLLTHTSGLREENLADAIEPYMHDLGEDATAGPTLNPRVNNLLKVTLRAPLATKPGEEMFYSNHNYRLGGEIVRRASACALSDFAEDRIFAPLGMNDTSFGLPDEHGERAIGWNVLAPTSTEAWRKTPSPEAGAWSTPRDTAVFGQLFLDGGRYGDARVLSNYSVAEMMRDQTPGVPASLAWWGGDIDASWGYGWAVGGGAKWPGFPIFPQGTVHHSGAGAMMLWADPVHQVVGVFFSICRYRGDPPEPVTNVDLFVNAVYAAVGD